MTCDQRRENLAAYLDGELPQAAVPSLQEHVRTCPHCAAEIASLVSLRRGLGAARRRYAPSASFKSKVARQVAQRPVRRMRVFELACAVGMLVLVALVVGWRQYSLRAEAFKEVADLHVNALASANPLDVVSTDRHTVKPWFQGRIPFSFNVPEFAGTEFNLLGGKMVYLQQQPGAQLIVAMRQHKISVLILRETPDADRLFAVADGARNRDGFNSSTWTSHDLRFFVVGDAEGPEIDRLAHLLMQANE
jgi:anti-sigma factor RsiW